MRDIALFAFVFGMLPFILKQPYIGVLAWSWLSYMNPHRLTWGPAYDFPFAQLVAVTLFVSLVLNPEKQRFPASRIVVVWVLFLLWTLVSTYFAYFPHSAWEYETRVFKIQIILFISLWLMGSPERIKLMVWVIFVSVGFFGIKGGVFTILTGGSGRVYGPASSFIAENNALAVALLMVIPLGIYLRKYEIKKKLHKNLMMVAVVLIAASVLGSFSRGALLAISAVSVYLWWKTPNKALTGILGALVLAVLVFIMPSSWTERMGTIDDYQQDQSSMERINSWHYAINIASDRLTGGGYNSWSRETFARWAPDPSHVFVGHSIYFSVLADHGWLGLILFLTVYYLGWRAAGNISKQVRLNGGPDDEWIAGLSDMIKVSLVAYAVGGAFLSLAYFDLPWHLLAIIVLLERLAKAKGLVVARRPLYQPQQRQVIG